MWCWMITDSELCEKRKPLNKQITNGWKWYGGNYFVVWCLVLVCTKSGEWWLENDYFDGTIVTFVAKKYRSATGWIMDLDSTKHPD